MSNHRKTKSVSFDLKDTIEADLLEYAESQRMFSRYIKRLIKEDIDKSVTEPILPSVTHIEPHLSVLEDTTYNDADVSIQPKKGAHNDLRMGGLI